MNEDWAKSLGYFGAIVGDLVGCVGAGLGLGYLAIKKWNAPSWVALITGMAGLALACYRIYRMTQTEEKGSP